MEGRVKQLAEIYEKKQDALKAYAETYLIAGAIPALIFPFLGLASSFITMASYQSYQECVN